MDTSISFGEWQQGEQTVAGVGVFKGPLSSVLTSYYSSITFINFKAAQLFVLTMEKWCVTWLKVSFVRSQWPWPSPFNHLDLIASLVGPRRFCRSWRCSIKVFRKCIALTLIGCHEVTRTLTFDLWNLITSSLHTEVCAKFEAIL